MERLNKENGLKRIIRRVSDYEILVKLEVPIREEKQPAPAGIIRRRTRRQVVFAFTESEKQREREEAEGSVRALFFVLLSKPKTNLQFRV